MGAFKQAFGGRIALEGKVIGITGGLWGLFGVQLLACAMDTKNANITNDLNSSDAPEHIILHFITMCLLAPCTVSLVNLWAIKIRIKLLILTLLVSCAILRRFLPSYGKVRLSDTFLFMVGCKGRKSHFNRRELWIIILYGIVLHNLLNTFNTYQMAFKTVSSEIKCYQTVKEFVDSDILVMAHQDFKPYLATIVHPIIQKRLVLANFTKVNLKSKRYAYVISCDLANFISKTVANYNQRRGKFMMAAINDPISNVILPNDLGALGPEFAPETGILAYHTRKTVDEDYHVINVQKTSTQSDKTNLSIHRSALWEVVWLLNLSSVVVFIVELAVHRVQVRKRARKVDAKISGVRTRSHSEPLFHKSLTKTDRGYESDPGCMLDSRY